MMLEPSSFLNSSIVGFFSLDFSHGLNDNPHKKNHSPTCFTLTLTALWSSSFSEALWWQRWKSVKGYFCLWGLFSGVSLTFRGLTILGLGRMDYYFKEIVSTNSSSCVESCFFSYCLHCSYETKLKALIGFFGFFSLAFDPLTYIRCAVAPQSHPADQCSQHWSFLWNGYPCLCVEGKSRPLQNRMRYSQTVFNIVFKLVWIEYKY